MLPGSNDRGNEMTEPNKPPQLSNTLRKGIADIPGSNGWWRSSGQNRYEQIAQGLLECGLDEIQVLETLKDAYWAVAQEFGL